MCCFSYITVGAAVNTQLLLPLLVCRDRVTSGVISSSGLVHVDTFVTWLK
jgi:hypothetical protein